MCFLDLTMMFSLYNLGFECDKIQKNRLRRAKDDSRTIHGIIGDTPKDGTLLIIANLFLLPVFQLNVYVYSY